MAKTPAKKTPAKTPAKKTPVAKATPKSAKKTPVSKANVTFDTTGTPTTLNQTDFDFDSIKTPKVPLETFVSPLGSSSKKTRGKATPATKTPEMTGMKRLFKTPKSGGKGKMVTTPITAAMKELFETPLKSAKKTPTKAATPKSAKKTPAKTPSKAATPKSAKKTPAKTPTKVATPKSVKKTPAKAKVCKGKSFKEIRQKNL